MGEADVAGPGGGPDDGPRGIEATGPGDAAGSAGGDGGDGGNQDRDEHIERDQHGERDDSDEDAGRGEVAGRDRRGEDVGQGERGEHEDRSMRGERSELGELGEPGGRGGGGERPLDELLLDAARRRVVVDLGGRELPADVVRALCTERAGEVDRFGIRVRNARVTGTLDLRAADVPFALDFAACDFAEAPNVEGAALHSLALRDGSRLPGLLGNGVHIRRDLDLSGADVWGAFSTAASTSRTAAIWLTEAEIGGRLLCIGTRVVGPADRCIQADRTRFGGNIRLLQGFVTDGELRFLAVHLDGSFDLSGARLLPKSGRAIDMAESYVGGSIFLIDDPDSESGHGPEIRGRVELGHTTVSGRLFARNATLTAPPVGAGTHRYFDRASETMLRPAVDAPRLSVVGDIELVASRIEGGLDLTAADVKGTVILDGLVAHNPGDRAIDLTNAGVGGDLTAVGLRAQGSVHLSGAHIGGSMRMARAYLSHPVPAAEPASGPVVTLAGDGADIARDVDLRRLVNRGGAVSFYGARLGAALHLEDARLLNGPGYAATFQQATINGSVHIGDGFRARGLVSFNRATIDGRLDATGGTFVWPGTPPHRPDRRRNRYDAAFWAIGATVRGGMTLGWRRVVGGVDLSDATTTYLADDPTNWGDALRITGFTYDRFAPQRDAPAGSTGNWDVGDRVRWLAGQEPLDPGPFEQAARVYRQHGRTVEAEEVLIHGLRLLRRRGAPAGGSARQRVLRDVRRARDWLFDRVVGYGYRTGRAFGLLAALVIVTAVILALPAADTAMRATGGDGVVYTPEGPLPASPAATPPTPAPASPDACGDGAVRCYEPLLLAIDTVVPIIDLGHRATWYPSRHDGAGWAYQIWLTVATILGWTISTVFALSFTRLARSG
ncbi:MAG TPA: hypothetical protein VIL36_18245 [Acidimicrobiales bacterium]